MNNKCPECGGNVKHQGFLSGNAGWYECIDCGYILDD